MGALSKLSSFLAVGLISTLMLIGSARATAFEVQIDTSGLSGDAVMAFDFNNSDDPAAHQLDIWDFASDGSLYVSATADPDDCPSTLFPFSVDACKDPAGSSVTGTLGNNPYAVTISDAGSSSTATITYYQKIDLSGASFIKFTFEMSGDANSGDPWSPDGFTFWLLNPGDLQEPGLNPGGDVLGPGPLILYTFDGECDTGSSEGTATCTRVPSVPEPKSLALAAAALLALVLARSSATALPRRNGVRS